MFTHPNYHSGHHIGIIDSGIGGIAILQAIMHGPAKRITYIADTAFMPYGSRTFLEIQQLTTRLVHWLSEQGITMLILACHTASAVAYEVLRTHFPHIEIVELVSVVGQEALRATRSGHIGILATPATIEHAAHATYLQQLQPTCTVHLQACPELAYALEMQTEGSIVRTLITKYVGPWQQTELDTLIIGCTHYSIARHYIQEALPTAHIIAAEDILRARTSAHKVQQPAQVQIYATARAQEFQQRCFALYQLDQEVHPLLL